ncbi:MAG TPA: TetR/AcrR family transcriptional regulator [Candidatus Blautia gallistercoris]|uniref:TetR/AcrR family transcriptional regulator n=1 Tax=Candidatus Blautia gallistercoris TaxID=2838490 RepID=A0A9D2B2P4_9FIRM|nr:TetR/AcrR family transcriptional regulator [Candidatus Blautia gallistercoris]
MDLRVEKTKRSIINAFLELRAKKPLEKITVKELCEHAWIHKSTFYSHYTDIYDLSEQLETETVNSIIQTLPHPETIFENPAEFTEALFLAYRSQDTLSQILFSGSRRGQLIAKTKAQLRDLVFRTYPEYEQDPIRNIVLSYAIYGSYYAYTENRHYGEDMVISALGQLTQAVTWTFSE